MRRFLLILAFAAGLSSAAPTEIRNRQECYTLPESSQGECLSAVRTGRTYQIDIKAEPVSSVAPVDSVSRKYSNIPRGNAPRESPKMTLEERSVIAQEELAKAQSSAASSQNSIANALWTMIITGFSVMAISLIVATTN